MTAWARSRAPSLASTFAYVGLDGLHAEEQLGGDLRVGPALCDEPQDLGFRGR